MKLINKIKNLVYSDNMEDNAYIVGEESVTMSNNDSVNWEDVLPNQVEPTIINLRTCYNKVDLVNGIINDLAIKSISGWKIEAVTDEIKEYLTKEFKRLDLNSLMFSNVIHNLVDGAVYYNVVIEDGVLSLRELAFDGDNYRIMEIKDPVTREVIGYKQVVKINKNTNKGWMKKKFKDLEVEDLEEVEFNFMADEVISTHFLTMYGVHQGIVETVLDTAYGYEYIKTAYPLLDVSKYLKRFEKNIYLGLTSLTDLIPQKVADFVQKIIDKLLFLGNFKSGSAKIVFEKRR